MANVAHSGLTDPNLHEPKGVAAASAGQIYVADGAASGDWRYMPHAACYYTNIGTGTTYTAPTSFTLINPTTTGDADPRSFTHNSAGRLTYTGTETLDFDVLASITLKHSSASLVDVHFQVYKNGIAVTGTRHATAALSGNYTHVTLLGHISLNTNDYVEVYVLSASGNVVVHAYNLVVTGKI